MEKMEPKEWNHNETVKALSKQLNVELDDEDSVDDDSVHFVGAKSCKMCSGGMEIPAKPSTKIYLNDEPGIISIDFNHY